MSQPKSKKANIAVGFLRFLMSLMITVIFYALAVFIIFRLAGTAYTYAYHVFGSEVMDSAPGRSITITVNAVDTMKDVAETLEQQGIIIDGKSFVIRAALTEKKVHPGTFTVNSSQSYEEILNILNEE